MWIEQLFLLVKAQAFIKTMIVILSIFVNVLLVEKPAETFSGLLINILKHSIFVLFALFVFSPVLTPWLVAILGTYFPSASSVALDQLSFGIVLMMSQQIILFSKNYFNNKRKEYEQKWNIQKQSN